MDMMAPKRQRRFVEELTYPNQTVGRSCQIICGKHCGGTKRTERVGVLGSKA